MSYWGYVMQSLMNEDREAAERRVHRKRRLKREREEAVLAAAAAALTKYLDIERVQIRATGGSVQPDAASARPVRHGA